VADQTDAAGTPGLHAVVGLDAAFLHIETPSTHWHVVGVVVLDDSQAPEPFDAEMLRRVLADRLEHVEVLRRRVVEGSRGISQPQWQHTEVDLDDHVRATSLPAGSGLAELAALAGEIGSRPLRRDRPMWEFTVVDGLADGRKAFIAKIHHSLVDGVAAVGIISAIFDVEPSLPPLRTGGVTPDPFPGRREYLSAAARTVVDQPAVVARSFTRLVRTAWQVVQLVRNRDGNPTLPLTAPRVSLSRSITPARSAAFAVFELDAVKEVRRAYGVTFNDVVMAVAAGVIRTWLLDHDDLPDRPLVAAIPTSVRAPGDGDASPSGNEVSALFGALPTHFADAGARVRFLAEEMPGAKAFHDELGPNTLGSLALAAPWNLASLLFRAYSDLGLADRLPPAVNLVLTSVPGPRVPLYCAGARMETMFPLGPIFDGAGLNVTVLSYTDKVCIGFLTCPDTCPPVQQLADAVPAAVAELVAAAVALDLETTRKETAIMDIQERNRQALAAVQERRDDYYEAILGLERAMAAAAGDDATGWAARAETAALDTRSVLRHHIEETEGPGSFYEDLSEHYPNLGPAAARLKAEHGPLRAAVDQLVETLSTVHDDAGVDQARAEALDLLKGLLAHRHRGAELVYDAYNVDVATGD
jgi:diacylglycerol O-acyltransferase / wax synthase